MLRSILHKTKNGKKKSFAIVDGQQRIMSELINKNGKQTANTYWKEKLVKNRK